MVVVVSLEDVIEVADKDGKPRLEIDLSAVLRVSYRRYCSAWRKILCERRWSVVIFLPTKEKPPSPQQQREMINSLRAVWDSAVAAVVVVPVRTGEKWTTNIKECESWYKWVAVPFDLMRELNLKETPLEQPARPLWPTPCCRNLTEFIGEQVNKMGVYDQGDVSGMDEVLVTLGGRRERKVAWIKAAADGGWFICVLGDEKITKKQETALTKAAALLARRSVFRIVIESGGTKDGYYRLVGIHPPWIKGRRMSLSLAQGILLSQLAGNDRLLPPKSLIGAYRELMDGGTFLQASTPKEQTEKLGKVFSDINHEVRNLLEETGVPRWMWDGVDMVEAKRRVGRRLNRPYFEVLMR